MTLRYASRGFDLKWDELSEIVHTPLIFSASPHYCTHGVHTPGTSVFISTALRLPSASQGDAHRVVFVHSAQASQSSSSSSYMWVPPSILVLPPTPAVTSHSIHSRLLYAALASLWRRAAPPSMEADITSTYRVLDCPCNLHFMSTLVYKHY